MKRPKARAAALDGSCLSKLTVTFCTCTKARCFLFSLPAKKAQPRSGILVCLWLVKRPCTRCVVCVVGRCCCLTQSYWMKLKNNGDK